MTTTSVLLPSAESGFKTQTLLRRFFLKDDLTFYPMEVESFPINLCLSNMQEHAYERCAAENEDSYATSFCFSFYAKSTNEFSDLYAIYLLEFCSSIIAFSLQLDNTNVPTLKDSLYNAAHQSIQTFHKLSQTSPPVFIYLGHEINDHVYAYLLSTITFVTEERNEGIVTFELILTCGKIVSEIESFLSSISDNNLSDNMFNSYTKTTLN